MRKKRKKEKKTDIVICTDARVLTRVLEMSGTSFGKQSEGIWLACLSMIVNMGKETLNLLMMNMLMLIYCV